MNKVKTTLQKKAERLKRSTSTSPRILMRVQEAIGELEAEIKALEQEESANKA